MSDTANTAKLASSEEFDARLKAADEDRWLATRYARPEARERLVAIYLFSQELRRALATSEPMLGKIRLQWWRETIGHLSGAGSVRRHDLAEELLRVTRDRADLLAAMNDLIDRFDEVIDDHMHRGHSADAEHEARHLATEASLARLAGLALDPGASPEQLQALEKAGEACLSRLAGLEDAPSRWAAARAAVRDAPAVLWPAILHLVAADPSRPPRSPLSKRWRMFQAALTRRI